MGLRGESGEVCGDLSGRSGGLALFTSTKGEWKEPDRFVSHLHSRSRTPFPSVNGRIYVVGKPRNLTSYITQRHTHRGITAHLLILTLT